MLVANAECYGFIKLYIKFDLFLSFNISIALLAIANIFRLYIIFSIDTELKNC